LASLEKKTYGYREWDEVKRQAFRAQLATLLPQHIVYVDEAGMDERFGLCLWLE
jgi:hypothetical protein